MQNVLDIETREGFRSWLSTHSSLEAECWVAVERKRPYPGGFVYLDAVEEALCFGWIDSVQKNIGGRIYQRFSPRTKKSPWTELNKERARRLIKLGLMTPSGKKALPPLGPRSFKPDPDVVAALKRARCYKTFTSFHPLYQRVRIYNVAFYKSFDVDAYDKALAHLIKVTKAGRTYGEWNDYGRLLDY